MTFNKISEQLIFTIAIRTGFPTWNLSVSQLPCLLESAVPSDAMMAAIWLLRSSVAVVAVTGSGKLRLRLLTSIKGIRNIC